MTPSLSSPSRTSVAPAPRRSGPLPPPPAAEAPASRPLGRRSSLPGGRAIVGGLLITVAAIGTFAAYTASSAPPSGEYVVASAPVRAGQRLGPGDLRLVRADLPDDVAAQAFTSIGELEGAVALAPLNGHELVHRSAVRRPSEGERSAAARSFSFAVERERALDGRIQRGERVDLLATYGSGTDARTTVVVRRVQVLDVDVSSSGGVGSSGKVTITLATETEAQTIDAIHALSATKLTVVRSTGTNPSDPSDPPAADRGPSGASSSSDPSSSSGPSGPASASGPAGTTGTSAPRATIAPGRSAPGPSSTGSNGR